MQILYRKIYRFFWAFFTSDNGFIFIINQTVRVYTLCKPDISANSRISAYHRFPTEDSSSSIDGYIIFYRRVSFGISNIFGNCQCSQGYILIDFHMIPNGGSLSNNYPRPMVYKKRLSYSCARVNIYSCAAMS